MFLSGDDAKFDFQNRSNKIQLRPICNQDTNLNFEKRVGQNLETLINFKAPTQTLIKNVFHLYDFDLIGLKICVKKPSHPQKRHYQLRTHFAVQISDHFSSLKIAPNWLKVKKKISRSKIDLLLPLLFHLCSSRKKNQHQLQKHIKINTHACSVTMKKIGQESGSISLHLHPKIPPPSLTWQN